MKKRLTSILLTFCMVLTLLPATAFAADTAPPKQNLYQVGSNPVYRSSPNGDTIGKIPAGTILEVLEIKGDWAKVRYEGKEYYMWAARLIKVTPAQTYQDGWYPISIFGGGLGVDFDGGAVLVNYMNGTIVVNRNFYLKNVGNGQITLRMLDGTYLGISGEIKNGVQLTAVKDPYPWIVYSHPDSSEFSLRPPANTKMAVNVSGSGTAVGTPIILWEHSDTPDNAWLMLQVLVAEDWTKTITRGYMAELLARIMSNGGGESNIKYYPPGPGGNQGTMFKGIPENTAPMRRWAVGYLRYWGVFPVEKFDEDVEITYGEFTTYLIKLMDYYNNSFGPGVAKPFVLTKDTIKKFALENFGQNTDPNAIMTIWHGQMLSDATVRWMQAINSNKTQGFPFPFPYPDGKTRTKTPMPAPSTPTVPTGITATPTNTKFMLNGAEVALPAYSIGGNNYVKLRDVGALLKTRFDVRFEDGKAKLYNHAAYTKTSGELAATGKDSKSATLSTTDFVWGDTGAAVTGLTAYTIGGNNYIKLRDIAKLFDFDVDWRDGKAWIEPDVSPYTED
jgi:uncharacterized protein YgiM (DUF1202 family)